MLLNMRFIRVNCITITMIIYVVEYAIIRVNCITMIIYVVEYAIIRVNCITMIIYVVEYAIIRVNYNNDNICC